MSELHITTIHTKYTSKYILTFNMLSLIFTVLVHWNNSL